MTTTRRFRCVEAKGDMFGLEGKTVYLAQAKRYDAILIPKYTRGLVIQGFVTTSGPYAMVDWSLEDGTMIRMSVAVPDKITLHDPRPKAQRQTRR